MNFYVVRSGDTHSNLVVPYRITPGTAARSSDYVAPPANSVLRIPAGAIQGEISVPIRGDTSVEPDETLKLILGTPAAFNPKADFPASHSYVIGLGDGYSTVAADFNGDGKLDLVAANSVVDRVSIILGDGRGGFAAPRSFDAGKQPEFIAAGDFNGDGKPDLAVANSGSYNVSILLGNGHGGFGAPRNFDINGIPAAIAVDDFNGDGKPDLVVSVYSNTGTGSVSVLLGNGRGRFGAATNFAVENYPRAIAARDLNADGTPDLVVANTGSNNVSILLGNGKGGFGIASNFGVGIGPNSVGVGDFDGDGKSDIVVGNSRSKNVSILSGDGSGGFGAARSFDVDESPQSVAVGDFNEDGTPDVAVSN